MRAINCMLDFETLGQRPSAAVVSLGAVVFDRRSIIEKKYWVFDLDEQIKKGRSIDPSTLQWWMTQSPDARKVFSDKSNVVSLSVFADQFSVVLGGNPDFRMWGNGADFDVSIMADLWGRTIQKPLPWKFWNSRCFRTVEAEHGCKKLVTRKGTFHNALDDAVYQTECLLALWAKQDAKP